MPSEQLNGSNTDSDLEFALETQSGFLVVVKGSGNDGRVALAVRRRVGTPPSSTIGLTPDEVKRLINLLGELSPAAMTEKDRLLVGRAREQYLDELRGQAHLGNSGLGLDLGQKLPEPPVNAELDLFMERDFPELANKRKKNNAPRTFLGATSSDPIDKLRAAIADFEINPKQIAMVAGAVVIVGALVLAAVAVLSYKPFDSHKTSSEPEAVAVSPSAGLEEFSRQFVLEMLNFKKDTYRQSQVSAMAKMTPELSKKYWAETGFPLSRTQLAAIPADQQVIVSTVNIMPLSDGIYQVDTFGQVLADNGAKNMPLHIRLTVSKDAAGKWVVTDQKDVSGETSVEGAGATPNTTTNTTSTTQNTTNTAPTTGTASATATTATNEPVATSTPAESVESTPMASQPAAASMQNTPAPAKKAARAPVQAPSNNEEATQDEPAAHAPVPGQAAEGAESETVLTEQ